MPTSSLQLLLLCAIALMWLLNLRVGLRWIRSCGVDERISQWPLAAIVPTAALIVSVHLPATVSLAVGHGLVTLETIAGTQLALTLTLAILTRHWVLDCAEQQPSVNDRAMFTLDRQASAGSKIWWLPVLIVGGVYAIFCADAVTGYPSGYDAVTYHLPLAVKWTREHALNLVLGHNGYSWPANGVITAFLLAFAGQERVFSLVHVPTAIVLAMAIFGLARAIGAGNRASLLAACSAVTVPIVVFQSYCAYVDLYGTAMWLCSLLSLTWVTRVTTAKRQCNLIVIAGLAAGIALGTKSTFLPLVAVLGGIVIAIKWIGSRLRVEADRSAPFELLCLRRSVTWFVASALVCSGFWFLRGAVQAGNPVYPIVLDWPADGGLPKVGVATADEPFVFPDRPMGPKLARWWSYPWREPKSGEGYIYGVDNGLGAAFATFVPIGFAGALFGSLREFRQRRRRDAASHWRMTFIGLVILGAIFLVTILEETLRFALPLVLLAVPLAAAAIDAPIRRHPRASAILLSSALVSTAAIETFKPVHSMLGRWRDGNFSRAWFYQVPAVIDELKPGSRVLNLADEPLNYALLGRGLQNVVIPPLLWQVLSPGGAVTADVLHDNIIDYIFVRAPFPVDWADNLPIDLVHDDTNTRQLQSTAATRLYRVIGPARGSSQ